MSKILIIGAGWEQEALIIEAKSQGHFVIATHPQFNTTGFKHSDVHFVKDSSDIDSHLTIAKTFKVDGVLSDNCDFSLHTSSVVSKALNLNSVSIQSSFYSNNKFEQRNACAKANILQPIYVKLQTLEDLKSAVDYLNYPLILKPVDSRGTFGVTIVKSQENLEVAFFDALANSASHTVICEKFIEGVLVTVDGFGFNNGHRSLAVASRSFELGEKPVTKEIVYPGKFSNELNSLLMSNHNNVCLALDYNQGHTHGEYIVTKENEIYLVECTNRGGGVYTSSTIVPYITGLNLNEILINQSLGIDEFKIEGEGTNLMINSVILTFLDFEFGKVIKSINLSELNKLDYVLKFRSIFKKYDMVELIENCASRHSMLVVKGSNSAESFENLKNFQNSLNIKYY